MPRIRSIRGWLNWGKVAQFRIYYEAVLTFEKIQYLPEISKKYEILKNQIFNFDLKLFEPTILW